MILMNRFEVARVVGLRAVQIADGANPAVHVEDEALRCDPVYVAALELHDGKLDARIERFGTEYHVSEARVPMELLTMLDSRDGGSRSITPRR